MVFKKILLICKRSAYRIYFLDNKSVFAVKNKLLLARELTRLKKAHDDHYEALEKIEQILRAQRLKYDKAFRGKKVDYRPYDLIITVGGDGTFLEAAHHATAAQVILGVNSAVSFSVGQHCVANSHNFKQVLQKIMNHHFQICEYPRLRISLDGSREKYDVLNDVLVCHRNPAMLSRYILKIGAAREEQRSSGIWMATSAGSSGAIHSAGGKLFKPTEKKIQYLTRELYRRAHYKYRLTGGVLAGRPSISVTSLMREGRVYMDGAHHHLPFGYGETIRLGISPVPLKTFKFK